MTPTQAARAIEDILAQLEAETKRRVANVGFGTVDVSTLESPSRTMQRYVQFEFATEYEYLPFSRLS